MNNTGDPDKWIGTMVVFYEEYKLVVDDSEKIDNSKLSEMLVYCPFNCFKNRTLYKPFGWYSIQMLMPKPFPFNKFNYINLN